jgi:hypothetical protein
MNYAGIPDYRQLSCGCCTGKIVEVGSNWSRAEDQCVCTIHGDIRGIQGRQPNVCSVHKKPRGLSAAAMHFDGAHIG